MYVAYPGTRKGTFNNTVTPSTHGKEIEVAILGEFRAMGMGVGELSPSMDDTYAFDWFDHGQSKKRVEKVFKKSTLAESLKR
jgi:hypothetical protein